MKHEMLDKSATVLNTTRRRSSGANSISELEQLQKHHKRASSIGTIGCPSTPPASLGANTPITRGPGSPSGSSCDEVLLDSPCFSRVLKVPDVAIPMQHSLLKRISAFQSKEELLEFVSHYHCLLDLINLVTCLYRLAKMSKEASRGRISYLVELQRHPTFQLLLRSVSSKFLQAHLNYLHTHSEGLKGVDGRCLANLTWALAKLDLSPDDSALTTELALTVAPFIIRTLDTSSPQGLANMLWSYAKLPVAPPAVVTALVAKITDQLVLQAQRPNGASTFDAQALSNSIWALAHLKSRGMDVDALRNPGVLRFMTELAGAAARALTRPHTYLQPPGSNGEARLPEAQRYLALVEREFSCQALVNIAWSFATLLGAACCQQPAILKLFMLIHSESLARLRCTALVLGNGQSLPYVGGGGFNEQALSNAVYAFDKVGLLSSELLGAVFEVSALRLRRGSMAHHPDPATFKPQELCTLLKACHTNIAPPWIFLGSLLRLLSTHPGMADSWTTAERLELHRACQLYITHQAEAASAVAALNRQGPSSVDVNVNQAVSAAQGLANSIASSISAAGGAAAAAGVSGLGAGPGPVGRLSNLGTSPPMGMPGEARMSSGTYAGGINRPRSSSGASGTGMGMGTLGSTSEAATSTFGQLPVSAAEQQRSAAVGGLSPAQLQLFEQLLHAQQQLPPGGAANVLGGGQMMNCPVCSASVKQQEALAHIDACLANRDLEVLLRRHQQQQEAAVRWAVQQQQVAQAVQQSQQQNLLLAHLQQQLQQQQQQQNMLAVVQAVAAQQQAAAQQTQQLQQAGLLGMDEFCGPTGTADAAALAPWMLETAGASRPPLRPMRRV